MAETQGENGENIRNFIDTATTQNLPDELQRMISKETLKRKLRDDPLFYNATTYVLRNEIRSNPEYAKIAIEQEGSLFATAPDNIKNNREIALAAAETNNRAYNMAGDSLKGDWELIAVCVFGNDGDAGALVDAFQRNPHLFMDTNFIAFIFDYCHKSHKDDTSLISFLGLNMQHTPMFSNEAFVTELLPKLVLSKKAMEEYVAYLDFSPQKGLAMLFASRGVLLSNFRADGDVVEASLKTTWRGQGFGAATISSVINFKMADDSLKNNKHFVLGLLNSETPNIVELYKYISDEFKLDVDILRKVAEKHGHIPFENLNNDFLDKLLENRSLLVALLPALYDFTTNERRKAFLEKVSKKYTYDKEITMLLTKFGILGI